MSRFSERMNIVPKRMVMQSESMDEDLRNSLWNIVYDAFLHRLEGFPYWPAHLSSIKRIAADIWRDFFKLPLDNMPVAGNFPKTLRSKMEKLEWYEVYDFFEFYTTIDLGISEEAINRIMERELSAYRLVKGHFVPVISKEEIISIEDAISVGGHAETHLSKAIELLSHKTKPDYRNSIKESISAVESICKEITGDSNATLGKALSTISKSGKVGMHKALSEAYQKLYGYTSDADGIRHALMEESKLDRADALYMLVACSAFINYLKSKSTMK